MYTYSCIPLYADWVYGVCISKGQGTFSPENAGDEKKVCERLVVVKEEKEERGTKGGMNGDERRASLSSLSPRPVPREREKNTERIQNKTRDLCSEASIGARQHYKNFKTRRTKHRRVQIRLHAPSEAEELRAKLKWMKTKLATSLSCRVGPLSLSSVVKAL